MATRRSLSATRLLVLTASPAARRSRAVTVSPRLRANLVLRRLSWAAAGDFNDATLVQGASLIDPAEGSPVRGSLRKGASASLAGAALFTGRPTHARPAA